MRIRSTSGLWASVNAAKSTGSVAALPFGHLPGEAFQRPRTLTQMVCSYLQATALIQNNCWFLTCYGSKHSLWYMHWSYSFGFFFFPLKKKVVILPVSSHQYCIALLQPNFMVAESISKPGQKILWFWFNMKLYIAFPTFSIITVIIWLITVFMMTVKSFHFSGKQ